MPAVACFFALNNILESQRNASVHAEVRWYGSQRTLKYRSDLVIIDDTDLDTNEGIFFLPSKGYGFNRYYAIIEIKLRRPKDSNSDTKYDQIIQDDISKLLRIKSETQGLNPISEQRAFVLVFDKKRHRKLFKQIDFDSPGDANALAWELWSSPPLENSSSP